MKQGEKITLLRRAHSYSVTDIAIKLNVSSYEVMDWEADKKEVPQEYLYPLCSLLGVTVSDFLDPKFTPDTSAIRLEKDETREREYEPIKAEAPKVEDTPKPQDAPTENPFEKQYMDGGYRPSSGETPRNLRKVTYGRFLFQRWFLIVIELIAITIVIITMTNFFNMAGSQSSFIAPAIFSMFGIVIFGFIFSFFFVFTRVRVKRYKYRGHEVVAWTMFTYKAIAVDGYTQATSEYRRFEPREIYAVVDGHKITFSGKELVDESGQPLEKWKK